MKIVFEINNENKIGTLTTDGVVDGKYIPLLIMNLLVIIAQKYKENMFDFDVFKNDIQKMFDIQLKDINNTVFNNNSTGNLSYIKGNNIN